MGTINWRSSILPMVAISQDLTNGNNQLAEQHPTNGGNLSRPDEWELSMGGAASYQWWQYLKT